MASLWNPKLKLSSHMQRDKKWDWLQSFFSSPAKEPMYRYSKLSNFLRKCNAAKRIRWLWILPFKEFWHYITVKTTSRFPNFWCNILPKLYIPSTTSKKLEFLYIEISALKCWLNEKTVNFGLRVLGQNRLKHMKLILRARA